MRHASRDPRDRSRDRRDRGFSAAEPRMCRKTNGEQQIAFHRLPIGASLSTPHRSPTNERESTVSRVPHRKGTPRRDVIEEKLLRLLQAFLRRKEHPRRLPPHGMVAGHVHLTQIGSVRTMGRKERHVHHTRMVGNPFSNAQGRSQPIHDVATSEFVEREQRERRSAGASKNKMRSRANARTSVSANERKKNELRFFFRTALIQNKNGVTIKSKNDRKDGKISLGKSYVGDPVVVVPVRIGVSRDGRAQKFVNCDALASVREFTLTDVKLVCGGLGSESIRPGGVYQIEIRFRPLCLGNPRMTIAFEFEDEESGITYHIIRFLLAHVTDADAELLKPTAPYERPPVKAKIKASQVIGGIPPPRLGVRCVSFNSIFIYLSGRLIIS